MTRTRLTTIPFSTYFDLEPWVGQRSATFTFARINGLTGQHMGYITPIRNGTLSHNTANTIPRSLNISLGATDTATIEPLTDRIDVAMVVQGVSYPLGRYMFTGETRALFTPGQQLDNAVLSDEMFLVDQALVVGINGFQKLTLQVYKEALAELSVDFVGEASPYLLSQAWGVGQSRGSVLTSSALTGDYFNPWFGNDHKLHLRRSFNPADVVPQFDYDAGNQVFRAGITDTSNLLTAANRFLVISNTNVGSGPIFAVATVPPNAPNSFANRGFYITDQVSLQLTNLAQAEAVANGLANRRTIFETVTLSTPPDPRHDSYDVVVWQGDLWLELSWSMQLVAGGTMTHTLRKGYVTQ